MALIACNECGAQISDKAGSCPKCGNPLSGGGQAVALAPPPQQEVSYYTDNSGVRVTSARVIIFNKTYSLANISSVSVFTQPAKRGGLIVFGLALGLFGVAGLSGKNSGCAIASLLAAGLAIAIAFMMNDSHFVRITAAGGETNALESKNRQYIQTVVDAINEAIVQRG
jgi:hypothetical protein